jgi:hypothetical protein
MIDVARIAKEEEMYNLFISNGFINKKPFEYLKLKLKNLKSNQIFEALRDGPAYEKISIPGAT